MAPSQTDASKDVVEEARLAIELRGLTYGIILQTAPVSIFAGFFHRDTAMGDMSHTLKKIPN